MIRSLFSTSFSEKYSHLSLLVTRVMVSIFMLTHGLPKFSRLTSGDEIKFADPFGVGPGISLGLAVFAEVVCSILIIAGLGTRLAAVFLIITMLVAALHAHADDPFATKEKALLYVIVYAFLLVFGSGKYSVDRFINRHKDRPAI